MDVFQKAQLTTFAHRLAVAAVLALTPAVASAEEAADDGPLPTGGFFDRLALKAIILVLFPSLPSPRTQGLASLPPEPQPPTSSPPPQPQPSTSSPPLPPSPLPPLPPQKKDPPPLPKGTPLPVYSPSPEPATLISGLLACGLVGLLALRRHVWSKARAQRLRIRLKCGARQAIHSRS